MLQATELSVEVGGKTTLRSSTFAVKAGDKVGLVGRNGAGKTSLFKVLGGESPPNGGKIKTTGAFGYLPQDPKAGALGSQRSALEHILSGRNHDQVLSRMEKLRLTMEQDPSTRNIERFTRAQEDFANSGGYEADSEARTIASGLGIPSDRLSLPLATLSGGERRRTELARILFAGSDVLLLDEPTNHIDVDAKNWLMNFLRTYRGALLVISHDLDLLDESINRVLHLDEGALVEYKGTYSQYKTSRKKDEERLAKQAAMQEAEVRRLSTLADGMRHQTAKRARVAKSLDKRVERLKEHQVDAPTAERASQYRFPPPTHCGRVVLEAENLSKSYGGPAIFKDVDFALERGERMLVLGLNGAGKTSLLRILTGDHQSDSGTFRFGLDVTPGYYAQEHEGIDGSASVLENMRKMADLPDDELRALLGMFDLRGDIAFQKAGTLSGGEKTKLALAGLVAGRHNLLMLDEPTNNLDPPSLEAIGTALSQWPGAMILVSHDARFVEQLSPSKVLYMPDGDVDYWSDDLLELVQMA